MNMERQQVTLEELRQLLE